MNFSKKKPIKFWLKRILICFLFLFLLTVVMVSYHYFDRIRTLVSLEMAGEHPLYVMHYYGDYGFDQYLKVGAGNEENLNQYLSKSLFSFLNLDSITKNPVSCTTFSTVDEAGARVFGRNYDYPNGDKPAILLYATPKNGYQSVSMINIESAKTTDFFGNPDESPLDSWTKRPEYLATPYLPFDGMNEYGLVVSVNSLPEGKAPFDPAKVTIGYQQVERSLAAVIPA